MSDQPQQEKLELENLVDKQGEAEELPPADKARLKLAGWVLTAIFLAFIASGGALIFGPVDRMEQTEAVFEFVKTMGPPIATLVIGFYFRGESL